MDDDIIAAIATGFVESAIGIIRISGKNCFEVLDKIFSKRLINPESKKIYYGHILNEEGDIIDEVLVCTFRGPHSFTGEDSFEISAHGGLLILESIMKRLISLGVRPAEPGEFTKRAFLNGKIDLAQAEAVAKVIASRSEKALKAAQRQLAGYVSNDIEKVRENILLLLAENELNIDHLDDDGMSLYTLNRKIEILNEIKQRLNNMLKSAESGKTVFEGFRVAIIGKPNVGKSSLLNAILGFERAIVTNIPGTTRDVVSEALRYKGMLFTFMDTAGIRKHTDSIERIGIQRSLQSLSEADIVIGVFDCSSPLSEEDYSTINLLNKTKKPTIKILNKSDLNCVISCKNVGGGECMKTSSLNKININALLDRLFNIASANTEDNIILLNAAQTEALKQAIKKCSKIEEDFKNNIDPSLISVDIMSLVDSLDEITGKITTEDMLDTMFKNFCVGK